MLKIISTVLSISLAAAGATAQNAASGFAKLDEAIEAARKEARVPGINVAIGKAGSIVYERGFGLADVENKVKATVATRFRTASIAKSMTAVCVMQLFERGQLELDKPFRAIYPDWPKKRWPLTCRQLLGHLGGIRHYNRRGESSGTKPYMSLEASLECFHDDPLLHEPGSKYSYTTYGFTLLGISVEQATDTDFAGYLQKHVWDVAGMKHSCVDNHFLLVPNRACGYQLLDRRTYTTLPESIKDRVRPGELLNCGLHDTSMKVAGGGLRSTASDLVRFGLALLGDKLVKRSTRDLMWQRQKTKDGKPTTYGLGFGLAMREGSLVVSHGGGQAGTTCRLVLLPEQDVAVALMSNLQRARINPMVGLLIEAATE